MKLAGINIHSDLGMCVISGNVELDMLKIRPSAMVVVNNWHNTQPESAFSAGDPELTLNELRTNNKPDVTLLRRF